MAICPIHLSSPLHSTAKAARVHFASIGKFLSAASISLLLSCAGAPPAPVAVSEPAEGPEQAFAQGDYQQAAELWEQQAQSAAGAMAAAASVRAADAWMLAGDASQARDNVRRIDRAQLTATDQARLKLVLADLALQANQPEEAQQLLQEAEPQLSKDDRQRFEQLQQKASHSLAQSGFGDISRSLALIGSGDTYQPQQALLLLQLLEAIPSGELAVRSGNARSDQTTSAWLDLDLLLRQNLVNAEQLPQHIMAWKERYPSFFMTGDQALELWLLYRQQFSPPAKLAVLLPGSGRLLPAAEAIRDGILSAYLDNPGGAEIFFLSTGEEGELATSAYLEALDRGAQWIIGPLQKPAIEALLSLPELTTPMLALNDLPAEFMAPAGMTGQIHGISLSQDQEAQALAREVALAGYRRAIIMAPESEWGERMALDFEDEFLQKNGQIVASIRFMESENDHSSSLERVLKIDESKARKQQLEETLQMKVEFEPIRRDDVDVIFLAATVTQGRSIRPQLRFHNAGDIPVYSPGKIFSGKPDPASDQDLNGIRFPTTPWQLALDSGSALPPLSSLRAGAFTSLYALGRDAWNLLPWLDLMKRDPDFHFAGASGYYRTDPAGELLREPAFAVFSGGLPVPFERPMAAAPNP